MISITGTIVKETVVANTPSVIDIADLVNGVYLLRSGNNVTKFIKK